jgi:hypothetical protein
MKPSAQPVSDQIAKTVICGIAGTSFMTISSELMSLIGQDFREPKHLTNMITKLAPFLSKRARVIAGWAAHYGMGFIFCAIYVQLWENRQIKHTLKNGLILGAISGVIGSLIWKGTFKAHPLPPSMNYTNFYIQRIPAHIVFAVFATLTYILITPDKPSGSTVEE